MIHDDRSQRVEPKDPGSSVSAQDRGARMRALFDEALGRNAESRDFMLRSAIGRDGLDEELVDEVRSLLAFVEATRIDDEPPTAEDRPESLLGCRVGGFTLERLVGIGGTAAVFEATQARPRRTVAVKVLRHAIGGRRAKRRFEREIEIAGRLDHPSIARVYDSGSLVVDGVETPWLAMEFVAGGRTVTAHAHDRGMDIRDRVTLFRSVLAGVAAAHRRGVIHRDLKPANLLVDEKGRVRVIDFGIARQSSGAPGGMTATIPGQVLGTVPFMAPEQLDGDPDAVDVCTDIYALGVVLHLLLTERMPYETAGISFVEAARRIREVEVGSLHRLDRRIDRDLDGVVQKALEKAPSSRYHTIEAFDEDLAAWLDGRPVEARPLGSVARSVRLARRRPLPVALGAAAVMSLLATIVVLAVMLGRESTLRARGNRATANAAIAAAAAALDRGDGSGVERHLDLVPDSERGWEHAWLRTAADRSETVIVLPHGDVLSVDVLPARDDRPATLLATGYRGTWAFDLPGPIWRWHHPEFSKGGCWKHAVMPDERRLVVSGLGPELMLVDLSTGLSIERCDTPGPIGSLLPVDNDTVILGGDDGGLSLLDVRTMTIEPRIATEERGITTLAMLPDGRVVAGTGQGALLETDPTLSSVREVRRYPRMVARVRPDESGRRLAVCVHGGLLEVLDTTGYERLHEFNDHLADVWDARFDDANDRLVSVGLDESLRVFDLTTDTMIERVSGAFEYIWSLALEEDRRHAWVGTKTGDLRRLALNARPAEVPGESPAIGLAWSPDGTRVAVRTATAVRLFDVATRSWIASVPLIREESFIPDAPGSMAWNSSGLWCESGRRGGLWRIDDDFSGWQPIDAVATYASIRGLDDGGVVGVASGPALVRLASDGREVDRLRLQVAATDLVVDEVAREVHLMNRMGGDGKVVKLDDFAAPVKERTYGIGPSFSLAISPDGTRIAAGCRERPGNVVTVPNEPFDPANQVRSVGHSGDTRFVAFLDGGSRIVSAADDGRVILYRVDDDYPLLTVEEFTDSVEGMAVAPDGRRIAVTDGRRLLILDPDRRSAD